MSPTFRAEILMPSPFAEKIREIRISRATRQGELARQLGMTRTQLSGLENDLNQQPGDAMARRIGSALELSAEEIAALESAAKLSRRRYLVPANAAPSVFKLVYKLMERSETLTNRDAEFLLEALTLLDKGPGEQPKPRRIYRKDKSTTRDGSRKEEEM